MRTRQLSFVPAPLRRARGRSAFSLVEVALAVGIVGSALLVIFSLIPVGLATLQDTGRQIVETEIYNKIGSELATTAEYATPPPKYVPPTQRTNLLRDKYCPDPTRFPAYFDAEGNELSKTAVAGSAATMPVVFYVRCVYGDGLNNNKPTAAVWSPAVNGELLSATVIIGYHADPGPTPTPSVNVRQRTFLLANHGN